MTDRLVMRLGLWSAVVVAVLGAVYLALLIGPFSTAGFVFPPATFVQLTGGIIAFPTAPALLVLPGLAAIGPARRKQGARREDTTL